MGGITNKTVHLSFAVDWSKEVNPLLFSFIDRLAGSPIMPFRYPERTSCLRMDASALPRNSTPCGRVQAALPALFIERMIVGDMHNNPFLLAVRAPQN